MDGSRAAALASAYRQAIDVIDCVRLIRWKRKDLLVGLAREGGTRRLLNTRDALDSLGR